GAGTKLRSLIPQSSIGWRDVSYNVSRSPLPLGRYRVASNRGTKAPPTLFERNVERRAGLGADVVHSDRGARMQLGEDEPTTLLHLEYAQIGDDEVDDSFAGDGQRALFQDFRAAVLGGVFHHRHHALYAGYEIHRSA